MNDEPIKMYRIKDWDLNFENNKSRERDSCSWCPLPNKQDGLGYGRIMRKDNGCAIYGAFVALVLMASKQTKPRGGHLTGTGRADGIPLTAEDISIKTQISEDIIRDMLDVTSSVQVGWLEVPAECPPSALEGKGREGKRIELKGREKKEWKEEFEKETKKVAKITQPQPEIDDDPLNYV